MYETARSAVSCHAIKVLYLYADVEATGQEVNTGRCLGSRAGSESEGRGGRYIAEASV